MLFKISNSLNKIFSINIQTSLRLMTTFINHNYNNPFCFNPNNLYIINNIHINRNTNNSNNNNNNNNNYNNNNRK